jgi:5'-nucleotidase / UDP-sugar diphosphatase
VPGIDFIVGGHTHTAVHKWRWVGDTLVTQAGAYGGYLGRIDFVVTMDGGAKITAVNGKNGRLWNKMRDRPLGKTYPKGPLIEVPAKTVDDPVVVAAYKPFRERADQTLDEVIGHASDAITTLPAASGEMAAGDFVADAVCWLAKSDIAVINSESIASGLVPGQIKTRDAFRMIGGFTRQRVVVLRMNGREFVESLSSRLLRDGALQLQVSGPTLSYTPTITGTVVLSDVTVNGAPIDPERYYTVAGQANIIQRLMAAVPTARVVSEPGGTTREALVGYIRLRANVSAPVLGRVNLLRVPGISE